MFKFPSSSSASSKRSASGTSSAAPPPSSPSTASSQLESPYNQNGSPDWNSSLHPSQPSSPNGSAPVLPRLRAASGSSGLGLGAHSTMLGPSSEIVYTDEPEGFSSPHANTVNLDDPRHSSGLGSSGGYLGGTPQSSMDDSASQHVVHDSPEGSARSSRQTTSKSSFRSDKYKGLGGRTGSTTASQAVGGLRSLGVGSPAGGGNGSSQTRLVSTPSPSYVSSSSYSNAQQHPQQPTVDSSSFSNQHQHQQPPQPNGGGGGGGAASRWLRRVASAPNTKLFNLSSSSSSNPASPSSINTARIPSGSTTKNGFLSPALTSDFPSSPTSTSSGAPPLPVPGVIPAGNLSLSSDGSSTGLPASSSSRSRSNSKGGSFFGGGSSVGKAKAAAAQRNLGIAAMPNGGGMDAPGKASFRRTYSSNSIKLRSVSNQGDLDGWGDRVASENGATD